MLDRVIEIVLIKELLCTFKEKCLMPFRFHNSSLAVTLLLSKIILTFLAALATIAVEPKASISADSERSKLLFVAKHQGFFAEHGLTADIVQVRSGPVAISASAANEAQFISFGLLAHRSAL
jgi:ABC-type nitrate/sulfonate/bicarbonate transport system substrate-binding protein